MLLDRFPDNTIIYHAFNPVELNVKYLFDNIFKKIFFFIFFSFMVFNIWTRILIRIILLPFKLGLISFTYSIFGFDMSWFLNLFNFFTLNIPHWVYYQYINLYNNWINWWYNIVKVKSISTVPVTEIKNNLKDLNKDINETEKSNKVWYIIGGIIIVGGILLGLWYFDYFSTKGPGPGPGGPNDPDFERRAELYYRVIAERNAEAAQAAEIVAEPIVVTDNSNSSPSTSSTALPPNPTNDAVTEMNRRMQEFNPSQAKPVAGGSGTSSSSSPLLSRLNRYNILDGLDSFRSPFSRPGSPASSIDSMETIRPSIRPKAVLKALNPNDGQ